MLAECVCVAAPMPKNESRHTHTNQKCHVSQRREMHINSSLGWLFNYLCVRFHIWELNSVTIKTMMITATTTILHATSSSSVQIVEHTTLTSHHYPYILYFIIYHYCNMNSLLSNYTQMLAFRYDYSSCSMFKWLSIFFLHHFNLIHNPNRG